MNRKATYYRLGKFNGQGPDLFMIRFWKPDGSFGSCQCVEEAKLPDEIAALRALGWTVARE